MNTKKLVLTILAVVIAMWATNFLIHGVFLKSLYQSSQNLWRPEADMHSFCTWMFGGQILFGAFFALIFVHGYKGKGWMEGVRYGLLVGGLQAGHEAIMYAVSPYPLELTLSWIGFGIVQFMIAGVVASLVYKK